MASYLNIERQKLLELISFDKKITRAKGLYLFTDTGDKYLDFISQFGAVPFGHNPDFLWQVLTAQQAADPGVMIQPFFSEGAQQLSRALVEAAPGDMKYVTFSCTGAEAVESAIKMAKAKTGRDIIVSATNSFHGKTMGAVLATGNEHYRLPFYPPSESFLHVPFNDAQALEDILSTRPAAAFIVEPVQGEGGMVTPAPGYLKTCEQLCKKYGTLLIVDEVQTGLGRTGKLFACEHDDVEPDILLIAKTLSGGLIPISACIAGKKAWTTEFGQLHTSTFANNHLATTIGCAVMKKLTEEPEIIAGVARVGAYLQARLRELVDRFPVAFKTCDGMGLMQGLTLQPWHDEESYLCPTVSGQGIIVPLVCAYLLNRHNICTLPTMNSHNVLRLQPCYLATEAEIDQLIHALEKAGELITQGKFSALIRAAAGIGEERPGVPDRPYKNPPIVPQGEKLGTFCFFVHPVTDMHTIDCMPGGQQAYTADEIEKIQYWLGKAKAFYGGASPAYYMPCIPSKNGGYVDGWLISSLLTPKDMMRLPKEKKEQLIHSYVGIAQENGADMIGLGAFTSVITRSGTTVADCGTPVTTGNAFTALTSTDSIRTICRARSEKMSLKTLGIVGVSGSVGRLCLLDIGAEFRQLYLIGNPRNKDNVDKQEVVAGEFLYKLFSGVLSESMTPLWKTLTDAGAEAVIQAHVNQLPDEDYPAETYRAMFRAVKQQYLETYGRTEGFPLLLSNDIEHALPVCDVIVTATSNGESFIRPDVLSPGAIVCDVARPSDLLQEVKQNRDDITAYDGGLVRLPANLRFGGPNIAELDTGVTLACLAETVILTMSQARKNYSIGGISSIEEAREVFQLALKHGFCTHLSERDIHGPAADKSQTSTTPKHTAAQVAYTG
ncbi:aminotransferase class III-fold pyridoxal phosphate-dependent enzyme [Vibrio quintilis]|uniref:Putrescine aminotransferase n=1 Tax=Vibrio quintilis TaxID=1117707 RepID=A0A1M7YY65_9VIBR|nr:aminotransferase class III-fold pyridoxal phosphate-dependent enzyme [Vibrio quintilis]SHO57534.1 Putrescine aminotransferase [Vibrio quintilis]